MNGVNTQIGVILITFTATTFAFGDAKSEYNDLFGDRQKAADTTASKEDDVAFAKLLMESVTTVGEMKDLKILMLEKAFEYGLRAPGGFGTANEALTMLGEVAPDRSDEWSEKGLQVKKVRFDKAGRKTKIAAGTDYASALFSLGKSLTRQGRASEARSMFTKAQSVAASIRSPLVEDIHEELRNNAALVEREKRLKSLKKILEADHSNLDARKKLVMFYIVELDQPENAKKIVTDKLDEKLQLCVSEVVKPIEELPEETCLELANWYYRELTPDTRGNVKVNMLQRAQGFCQRYLEVNKGKGIQRLKVKTMLTSIRNDIEKAIVIPHMPRGPVVIMTFDKSHFAKKSGKMYVRDLSGLNNHGFLSGNVKQVPGRVGGGIAVDGKLSYVELPNSKSLQDIHKYGYTLSAWYRPWRIPPGTPKTKSFFGVIIKQGWHSGIGYHMTGRAWFGVCIKAGETGTTKSLFAPQKLTPKRYYHLVATVDMSTGRKVVYINGEMAASSFLPAGSKPYAYTELQPWRIGIANPLSLEHKWEAEGVIDEVAIYPRPLSGKDVRAIYMQAMGGKNLAGQKN